MRSRSCGAHAGRRGLHRDGAIAERLGLEARCVQFLGDARVIDLLLRRELQDHRHQQPLHFHASGGALFQHLLEQNALMRHVLVDDPQPVASGGDDEALVDLAERAQIARAPKATSRARGWHPAETRRACRAGASSLPEGGGPGATSIGGALKSRRGAGAGRGAQRELRQRRFGREVRGSGAGRRLQQRRTPPAARSPSSG